MPMKKIGYILLAVLLLLPCIVFPAWAQAPSLALEASGGSGEAGETVTVAVRLTENLGVTSVKLSLSYDSTALVLKKAENGTGERRYIVMKNKRLLNIIGEIDERHIAEAASSAY